MGINKYPGQYRRNFLKILVVFLGPVARRLLQGPIFADPKANDELSEGATAFEQRPIPNSPTPAELVALGEHLSYLANLPAGARVNDAVREIHALLAIVNDRDLPATLAASRPIWNLRCHYGIGSTVLSESSKRSFAEKMIPIRHALMRELKGAENE